LQQLDYRELESRQMLAVVHGHGELRTVIDSPGQEVDVRVVQNLPGDRTDSRLQSQASAFRGENSGSQPVSALSANNFPTGVILTFVPIQTLIPQSEPLQSISISPDIDRLPGNSQTITSPSTSLLLSLADSTDDGWNKLDSKTGNSLQSIPQSSGDFGLLIGKLKNEPGESSGIDDYFSLYLPSDSQSTSVDSGLEFFPGDSFDFLETERNPLNNVLSGLQDLPEDRNGIENQSRSGQTFMSEQQAPLTTRTESQRANNPGYQPPPVTASAIVQDGGMILLGFDDDSANDGTVELLEFLATGADLEIPVADVHLEMSVGIVQSFDVGSREQSANAGDASDPTVPMGE
jgi:hypothetical protein